MSQVRQAAIEWVSLTLQKERPGTPKPREQAEALLEIAEDFYVPVEELRKWIQQQDAHTTIDTHSFQNWAKAYDATRAMNDHNESNRP